jgi:putative DNA primase/helicase
MTAQGRWDTDTKEAEDMAAWAEKAAANGHRDRLLMFGADDAGNADALNLLFGSQFLYCSAYGWLYWAKTHWEREDAETILRTYTIKALRKRRHVAVDAENDPIVGCTKSNSARISCCIIEFKRHVTVSADVFDASPDELNCKNGVLNLRLGSLRAHHPTDRFTYCLPVGYNDRRDITEWTAYLGGVVGGGDETMRYFQLAMGYTLTGHTREEILFYLFGPTRSGKGTIAETMHVLLGNLLSVMADFNTFTAKRDNDTSNFDLASLKPARAVFASESTRTQSLNPAKIKAMTGGDDIRCCFKHKDYFTYRPQFKMWMLSNHQVNGDPDDDALWGRVRVIPFPNSYLGKEDKTLKARFKREDGLEMVLRWAVAGTMAWYALGEAGFGPPPEAVRVATEQHRVDVDTLRPWLETATEKVVDHWVSDEEVWHSYTAWCQRESVEYPKGRTGLLQSLRMKGYDVSVQRKVDGKNLRGVVGLRLVERPTPPNGTVVF